MRRTARSIVSLLTTPLWKPTVVGICVGAVIGGLALSAGNTSEASALIRIYPPLDVTQIMTGATLTPDSQQSYISGEITYLNSRGFGDAVAKELNETTSPQISATQDAQSSMVTFSASEENFADAERIVNAALKVYGTHVAQQTRERGQAAIDSINAVMARLQSEPAPPPGPADPGGDTTTGQSGVVGQLLMDVSAIQVQMQRLAPFQVVQPPTETTADGVPKWALGMVGGGLLGGLAFLGAALVWRRRVGVVASPSALDGVVERVLMPTVALGRLAPGTEAYTALARTLNNQLPAPHSETILVVGASAESGTSDVARLLASGVDEHSGVRVVSLLDNPSTDSPRSSLAASGPMIIIDGGSIDTSSALPQAADVAAQVVVVARIGCDVIDEVRMAALLGTDRNLAVSAVCTKGSSRPGRNTKHRPPQQDQRTGYAAPSQTLNGEMADRTEGIAVPKK